MATQTVPAISARRAPAARLAFAGLTLGILSCALLTYILMFVHTSNGPTYTTTGDYWLTASGIPFVVALLLATAGIHNLHGGRDGLPGRVGVNQTERNPQAPSSNPGGACTAAASGLPSGRRRRLCQDHGCARS
jgi:hypothetical protein